MMNLLRSLLYMRPAPRPAPRPKFVPVYPSRADRTVTVKMYETSYDPPEPDEDDWRSEGDNTDENVWTFTTDDLDDEYPTFALLVANHLENNYATYQASNSHFTRGTWYTTEPEIDYRTGVTSEQSYHVDGLRIWEEMALFRYMTGCTCHNVRRQRKVNRQVPVYARAF